MPKFPLGHLMATPGALKALNDQNEPPELFRRSASLTRIGIDENDVPYTETLDVDMFRGYLERACDFMKVGKQNGFVPIPPPMENVRDGMTRRELWQFPPLIAVTEVPVLRSDGSILDEPGARSCAGPELCHTR